MREAAGLAGGGGMPAGRTFMCSTATQREAQGQAKDTYRWYRPAAGMMQEQRRSIW